MQNWAGNYTFQASRVAMPSGVEEIQRLVRANDQLRAVGTRHCFNDIADSPGGTMVSLAKFDRVLSIDSKNRQVTVEAAITYGQLAPVLEAQGLALHNLASLPHISIAGAIATATHGSGEVNGNLATAVAAIEWVDGWGTLDTIDRSDSDFAGVVVNLGSLGIVTKVTLDCVPTFQIAQHVYRDLPMQQFVTNLDEIVGSAYSASVFTDWQRETVNSVWLKCLPSQAPFDLTLLGAARATRQLHPIEGPLDESLVGIDPSKCTDQLGVPGPWHERLPHFKLEFTPSSGEELQSEYFVPRERAAEAYAAVATLREELRPLIQICELRFIAADGLWLSGSFSRDTAAIHFTWRRDQPAVDGLLHKLEAVLEPFEARPHWGKRFVMSSSRIKALYPKWEAFADLMQRLDPAKKFQNTYNRRVFGA